MKHKQRILIIQPYLSPYRIDIYNFLSNHIDIKLIYWFKQAPEQNFNLDILKSRCRFKYEYLKFGFTLNNRVFKVDIINKIIKYRPTIIICHEYGFFTIISLFLSMFLKFKVVVNTDDNLEMLKSTIGIRLILQKICLNASLGVITTNPFSLAFLTEKFYHIKNRSIFYPILYNEKIFTEDLSSSLEIAQKLSEKYYFVEKKILLYVGRLAEVKGLDFLINAYDKIVALNRNIVLVIVGSGPEENKLKNLVYSLGLNNKIIFIPRTDGLDLLAWYNIGQIFILPSKFEPFGAVVNEALIAGNLVIASSKVGSNFLITSNNGAIFETDNANSMINITNQLIQSIYPTDKIIKIKPSKSEHSFVYYSNLFLTYLINLEL